MKTVTKNWLACAVLAALSGACGDSGGENNDGDDTNTGGNDNGGNNTVSDAGQPPKDLGPEDVEPSECGALPDGTPLDTSSKGGCFYFYCYQTEDSLRAQSTAGGGCASGRIPSWISSRLLGW